MRFKLDENLGRRCADLLVADGHDVTTVAEEAMTSAEDPDLIALCRNERRALVTLDLDFSNPLIFPPDQYYGIAVLRTKAKPALADLVHVTRTLADAIKREDLVGRLWIVEPGRVRVYQPPRNNPA